MNVFINDLYLSYLGTGWRAVRLNRLIHADCAPLSRLQNRRAYSITIYVVLHKCGWPHAPPLRHGCVKAVLLIFVVVSFVL
jgi:hypothetical protein